MSKFEDTMKGLGYVLEEQEGKKLTYRKNAQYSQLVLIFDLESKYINPILVPLSIVLYELDLISMIYEFRKLREDASLLAELAHYDVLNKEILKGVKNDKIR